MIYLLMGLLFSGFLSVESLLASFPPLHGIYVDAALPVLLLFAARGRGRALVSLSFLAGLMRAAQAGDPAGWHILAYLVPGLLLYAARGVFFLDRAVPQAVLTVVLALFSLGVFGLGTVVGTVASPFSASWWRPLLACFFTGLLAPFLFRIGRIDRSMPGRAVP